MLSTSRGLPLQAFVTFALVAAIGCRSSAPPQEADRTEASPWSFSLVVVVPVAPF
jgi:hypothetical protein